VQRLPAALRHAVCFGQTRRVSWQSTISVGGSLYSVPLTLVDERLWARVDRPGLLIVYADPQTAHARSFDLQSEPTSVAVAGLAAPAARPPDALVLVLVGRARGLLPLAFIPAITRALPRLLGFD
jgi:hypothetical protein